MNKAFGVLFHRYMYMYCTRWFLILGEVALPMVTELVSEQVPEQVSEQVPELVSEQAPELVSEQVPELVSEQVPELVSEQVQRLAQGSLPVRLGQKQVPEQVRPLMRVQVSPEPPASLLVPVVGDAADVASSSSLSVGATA